MTIVYVPRLIESAEQAEALPVGTVALTDYHGVAIRIDYGLGWSGAGDEMSFHHDEMVGGTALVPIEAEEELQRTYATPASTFPGLSWPEQHDAWKRRLVTPWEAA